MKNRTSLLCTLAILYFFVGCSSTKINTNKPENNNFTESEKSVSTIAAPIFINLNDVTKAINRQFYSNLYSDNSFDNNGNDNLKLIISKRNLINVNATGNTINVSVPLKLEGTYRFKKSILGMNFNKEQNFNFNIIAQVKSIPSLDRNWNLNLKSVTNIVWEDLPVIDFAGIKIDFPKMFSSVIESQTAIVSSYIDKEVPKIINIRNEVEQSWNNTINPFLVNQENNAWLMLRPKNIFITPLEMLDTAILFTTGITSVVELVSGFKPEPNVAKELPALRQVSKLNEKVNFVLNTSITFDQINALLKNQIGPKGMLLKSSDYNILVTEAKSFGSGDKLTIAVKLNGKVKKGLFGKNVNGTVYLEGTPFFNPKTKTIEVKNFDFNVDTKDVLTKSASWLLNAKPFKNALQKNLIFDVSDQIDLAKNQANDALNKRYSNYVNLEGFINNIEPRDVNVNAKALSLIILAEGKMNVRLNKF